FLEVGPHPVLSRNLAQCLAARREEGHIGGSLRREREERRTLLESLGALYAYGYPMDFQRLHSSGGRCVSLPAYPWQRDRYWPDTSVPVPARRSSSLSGRGNARRLGERPASTQAEPLLGERIASPLAQIQYQALVGVESLPFLKQPSSSK